MRLDNRKEAFGNPSKTLFLLSAFNLAQGFCQALCVELALYFE